MALGDCCYTYVFPCAWEDHCKIGFSRDPFTRIAALHPRWYEMFDVDRVALVEVDHVREARDLELRLRRPLAEHNAPAPSTVRVEAAGHTEWFRGASAALEDALRALADEGHPVHLGRPWLAARLSARADTLYEWTAARFVHDGPGSGPGFAPLSAQAVRDRLDAYTAFGIALAPWLPPPVMAWYEGSLA